MRKNRKRGGSFSLQSIDSIRLMGAGGRRPFPIWTTVIRRSIHVNRFLAEQTAEPEEWKLQAEWRKKFVRQISDEWILLNALERILMKRELCVTGRSCFVLENNFFASRIQIYFCKKKIESFIRIGLF